jgi:hypothetical protein
MNMAVDRPRKGGRLVWMNLELGLKLKLLSNENDSIRPDQDDPTRATQSSWTMFTLARARDTPNA